MKRLIFLCCLLFLSAELSAQFLQIVPPQKKKAVAGASFSATGGTITHSGGKTIHTFTTSGTFVCTGTGNVEVLVVAGGGGVGNYPDGLPGAGGAGGVIYNTSYNASGTITVIVGDGGTVHTNGSNSVFGTLTAIGGGHGGDGAADAFSNGENGASGGSGGGGGACYTNNNPGAGGGHTSGQGYDGFGGGANASANIAGGGGGSAGDGATSRVGGIGISSSISGATITYAEGGMSPTGMHYGNGGGASGGTAGVVIISYPTP